jgi:hypothetical protein
LAGFSPGRVKTAKKARVPFLRFKLVYCLAPVLDPETEQESRKMEPIYSFAGHGYQEKCQYPDNDPSSQSDHNFFNYLAGYSRDFYRE